MADNGSPQHVIIDLRSTIQQDTNAVNMLAQAFVAAFKGKGSREASKAKKDLKDAEQNQKKLNDEVKKSIDLEIKARKLELQRQVMGNNTVRFLKDFNKLLDDGNTKLSDHTDNLKTFVNNIENSFSGTAEQYRRRIERELKVHGKMLSLTKEHYSKLKKSGDLEAFYQLVLKRARGEEIESLEGFSEELQDVAKEMHLQQMAQRDATRAVLSITNATRKLDTVWRDKLGNATTSIIDKFGSLDVMMATFTAGLVNAYNELNQFGKGGVLMGNETIGGLFGATLDGIAEGMNAEQFASAFGANKQLINIFGGKSSDIAKITENAAALRTEMGGLGNAARYTLDTLSSMARNGIKPVQDTQNDIAGHFRSMNTYLGLTGEQHASFVNNLMESEEVRFQMARIQSDEQRRMYMKSLLAQTKELAARGLNTEQILAATKSLEGIAGMDPRERFKKAARMAALGGALGVKGSGRLADLMRKGPRMSPSEKQEAMALMQQMQSGLERAQMAGPGMEFMANAVAGDLQSLMKNFSTSANRAVAADDATRSRAEEAGGDLTPSWMDKFFSKFDQFTSMMESSLGKIALGFVEGGILFFQLATLRGIAGTLSQMLARMGVGGLMGGKGGKGGKPRGGGGKPGGGPKLLPGPKGPSGPIPPAGGGGKPGGALVPMGGSASSTGSKTVRGGGVMPPVPYTPPKVGGGAVIVGASPGRLPGSQKLLPAPPGGIGNGRPVIEGTATRVPNQKLLPAPPGKSLVPVGKGAALQRGLMALPLLGAGGMALAGDGDSTQTGSDIGGLAGTLAGGWAGAQAGSMLGTMIGGPIGTAIGGLLGGGLGIAGSMMGYDVGADIGAVIGEYFKESDEERAEREEEAEKKRLKLEQDKLLQQKALLDESKKQTFHLEKMREIQRLSLEFSSANEQEKKKIQQEIVRLTTLQYSGSAFAPSFGR